jgi:hypothetical protein
MIWHSKHLVSDQIEKIQFSGKIGCFGLPNRTACFKCFKIVALFDDFTVQYVSRDENIVTNDLAQQASGFRSNRENSVFWKNRMFRFAKPDSPVFNRLVIRQSILLNQVQQNRMV